MTSFPKTESDDDVPPMPFVCQHAGCGTKFGHSVSYGEPQEIFSKIYHAIIQSRQFCMKHGQAHARIVCQNARIAVPEIGHCMHCPTPQDKDNVVFYDCDAF